MVSKNNLESVNVKFPSAICTIKMEAINSESIWEAALPDDYLAEMLINGVNDESCDHNLGCPDLNLEEITRDGLDYTTVNSEEVILKVEVNDNNNDLSRYTGETKRGPPNSNNFTDKANFHVVVNSSDVQKKKFLYSYKLNRIYVDVNCNFSLSFNWDNNHVPAHMFIRSTVVFSEAEQSEKRVERCLQHLHESSGLPGHISKNVLHSARDVGTQGVYYCGDANVRDSWFSVVVYHNKTNEEPCTHAYKFTCKSSCPSGINRRPIAIIFTLEDVNGHVYGRQTVGAKVCACLRRDLHKDEESEGLFKTGKKRIPSNQIVQRVTKKIKVETRDVEHHMAMLPNITVEVNAMASGLRTMIDAMKIAGQHDPEVVEKYATSIAQLRTFLSTLENGTVPQ
ncbi:unnamed protein product [Arctia plantaginis]|uniref:p53 DNA-binding domain-containing protein n=1 Tax=Arctia plantaginis TaxID=874455 RepID=A0A8S1B548_ARCPL|nr:unnamed protein product [Arctia plantaginis]